MSSTSLRWLIAPALATAALGVGACGSKQSSSSSSSGSAGNPPGVNGPAAPVSGQKKGGTLTVLSAGDVDNIDPGEAYYSFTYEVIYPLIRPLYANKPVDDGSKPVPDLADGDPQISDGGKTVTIKIKQGIKYSPPYSKVVTTKDVKYAIERAFTPAVPNGYINSYFGSLVGVAAFKSGKAKDISGIETPDDNTIVFHVTGGDIVGALVLPVSSPVPEAYARKYDSAKGQSTYGQHQLATGPYMLSSYSPNKSIKIVRNPNWDASQDYKPAYLDSVTFKEGFDDPGVATRLILNGKGMASGDFPPPPDQLKSIVSGPQKDQMIVSPGAGMRYVGIDTTIKPFDNVNVRKAVAAILDRQAMLQTRGGRLIGDVATHMLYPTVQGFDEAGGQDGPGFDFLKTPNGDPKLAADYMKKAGYPSGKYTGGGTVLEVGDNTNPGKGAAEITQRGLQALGFKVKLREVTHSTMYTKFCQVPKAKAAICPNLGWIKDYADPRTVIDPLWNPKNIVPSGNVAFSQFKGDNIGPEIDAAIKMPPGDARVQAWAALDKKVTGDVLGAPYIWDRYPVVASKDVQMVNSLWNQGSVDYAFSSLK